MTAPPQEWSLLAMSFMLALQCLGLSSMIKRLQRIVFRLEDVAWLTRQGCPNADVSTDTADMPEDSVHPTKTSFNHYSDSF